MKKIWISKEKGDVKILAISEDRIILGNPKLDKIDNYKNSLEMEIIPSDLINIPFSIIRQIKLQEGKKYIQVLHSRDSEELIWINDLFKRKEIFQSFKELIPNTSYNLVKLSAKQTIKKPLIAMIVAIILFIITLVLTIPIERGYEYQIVSGGASLSGIIIALANLGLYKVIVIFGILIGFSLLSINFKLRNIPTFHIIQIDK
jgi:hypothetical protein